IASDLRTLTLELRDNECYERRTQAIARWAQGADQRPTKGHGALMSGLGSINWETVKSGAVAHMPLDERLALASFYRGVENQLGLVHQLRLESQELAGYMRRDQLDPQEAHALVR